MCRTAYPQSATEGIVISLSDDLGSRLGAVPCCRFIMCSLPRAAGRRIRLAARPQPTVTGATAQSTALNQHIWGLGSRDSGLATGLVGAVSALNRSARWRYRTGFTRSPIRDLT